MSGKAQPRLRVAAENAALCRPQGRFPPLRAVSAACLSFCLPLLAAPSPPASPADRASLDDSASLADCATFTRVTRIPFSPSEFSRPALHPPVSCIIRCSV
jgi:hypothetical protein